MNENLNDFLIIKENEDSVLVSYSGSSLHVEIPDGITIIGEFVFSGSLIESVKLPDSVRIIRKFAFYKCFHLKEVKMGNSLRIIEERGFSLCTSLKEIELKEPLEEVGYSCFLLSGLRRISIPKTLKVVKENGMYLPLLTMDFQSEEAILSLGDDALTDPIRESTNKLLRGKEIKTLKVPDGIEEIKKRAFKSFLELEQIEIPDSVKRIGEKAFQSCSSLRDVHLSNSLEEIPAGCFYYCINLEKIIIPEKIEKIEKRGFFMAYGLKEITFIGSENLTIEKNSFSYCESLEKIIFLKPTLTNILAASNNVYESLYPFQEPEDLSFIISLNNEIELERNRDGLFIDSAILRSGNQKIIEEVVLPLIFSGNLVVR